jgi:hypothetical protein
MGTPRSTADIHDDNDSTPKIAHLARNDDTHGLCGQPIQNRHPEPADGDWTRCPECTRLRLERSSIDGE